MRDYKQDARMTLRIAVRNGTIKKPSRCERCRKVRPLHGHHAEYFRPLNVKWLCGPCHRTVHNRLKPYRRRTIRLKNLNLPISKAVHDACKRLAKARGLKLYALVEQLLKDGLARKAA